MPITRLNVNNSTLELDLPEGVSLLEALRDYAGLTGTKYGCGEGQCGACAVLVDGVARKSCLLSAAAASGKKITTIEGLASGTRLHPVQQAFLDHSAFQCGFCTPGMIVAAVDLLRRVPKPRPADIAAALDGHICRCGVHPRIVQAVTAVTSPKENRRG